MIQEKAIQFRIVNKFSEVARHKINVPSLLKHQTPCPCLLLNPAPIQYLGQEAVGQKTTSSSQIQWGATFPFYE